MKNLVGAMLIIALFGCGGPKAAPSAAPKSPAAQKWDSLKTTLDKMSPEERAKYLREHPEAVQGLAAPSP